MLDSRSPARNPARPADSSAEGGIYAALDLGTNNCRLLIARYGKEGTGSDSQIRVLDSYSKIVRLGEGILSTGELSEAAMARTLEALKQCTAKLKRYEITRARFVATEACRRARNTAHFLERVRHETGIEIDIISNEEEARLAFEGCASLLDGNADKALVFDIGGGSTEFMWVETASSPRSPRIVAWDSISYGVMNLSEHFGGNSFSEVFYDEMVQHIRQSLEPFNRNHGIPEALTRHRVQMLCTSGTVTTIAAIHLKLQRYDRNRVDGLVISNEDIYNVTRELLAMRPSQRFNHPCIGADRADYILSGCAILEAICRTWPIGQITIADRGVREGIIMSLMQEAALQA
jgi:exopolyphosphatase/guanosine-5'-triphosphate,3'-diphosphate pyrophosphatase